MNMERFKEFSAAYHAGLLAAVSAPEVANKMLDAIEHKPFGVNYTGDGFKRACKTLGIKNTRKAILEFIGVQS